jgi:hypothetical protein
VEIIEGKVKIYRLGKQAPTLKKKTLKIGDFLNLSVLPTPPAAFDWSMIKSKPLVYGMDGNDNFSDCVFASACHHIGTWSGNTGEEQIATEADALAAYGKFAGFKQSDPSTDNGASMVLTATQWRTQPIFNHTIAAFASVDLKRLDLVAAAAYLFGGLWIGWQLPKAWQGANSWDVPSSGNTSGDWAPGSWGGHATHVPAFSPRLIGVKTWQQDMPATIPAFAAYADEAYALISKDIWLQLTGDRCPAGVDGAALQAALAQVTA